MSTSDTLLITVPQGQGEIKNFTLKPSLPENGQPGNWVFQTIESDGSQKTIENLIVEFNKQSSWIQKQSEMCVLVVTINESGWRFAMEGAKSCANTGNTADVLHDVRYEISGNGKVLAAYIKSLGNFDETVGFSFVAAHVEEDGTTIVYQSPDPKTSIRR